MPRSSGSPSRWIVVSQRGGGKVNRCRTRKRLPRHQSGNQAVHRHQIPLDSVSTRARLGVRALGCVARATRQNCVCASIAREAIVPGGSRAGRGAGAILRWQKTAMLRCFMSCASSAESTVNASSSCDRNAPSHDTYALGENIAALAARLHAATYELLVLLQQFDEQLGWNTGFLSCAHWLHWRTGIDLGAAREKVRVARALPALPVVSAHMRQGNLSYAKVRALTRVATPQNEQSLVDLALAATAAHVERFVRAWRRVDEVEAARCTESRHLHRQLATWVDDDGMVVIRGRLTPEVGAVVQRALEAAADQLFRQGQAVPTGNALAEEVTPAQRRADALGLLAETALSADLDTGSAGDRYQVVVHVDAMAADAESPFAGTLELNDGATYVSAETSRRMSCDASRVVMRHADDGRTVDVGRKRRTIPPSIRRALAARDATCQFPGCTALRCDAHHVQHWADGGATSLRNLVHLCRRHHRAVHEGGFQVVSTAGGQWTFHQPDGRVVPRAPAAAAPAAWEEDVATGNAAASPAWDGTAFDVAWALDVLYRADAGHGQDGAQAGA